MTENLSRLVKLLDDLCPLIFDLLSFIEELVLLSLQLASRLEVEMTVVAIRLGIVFLVTTLYDLLVDRLLLFDQEGVALLIYLLPSIANLHHFLNHVIWLLV